MNNKTNKIQTIKKTYFDYTKNLAEKARILMLKKPKTSHSHPKIDLENKLSNQSNLFNEKNFKIKLRKGKKIKSKKYKLI